MKPQSSIVLELQRLATDKVNDVADLCRKALLVATKLKLDDFRAWIGHELNGYEGSDEVPAYRRCQCQLRLKNPYRGLIPMVFEDNELADLLSNVKVLQPIGELVDLLANKQDGGFLTMTFSPAEMTYLIKAQQSTAGASMEPVRMLGANQIAGVIDAVRTTILEWSLKLEDKGILGEGLTFSDDEKRRAAVSPEIRIQNFQGVIGDVSHSTVVQHLKMEIRPGDFDSLRKYLRSLHIQDQDLDELQEAIGADPAPARGSLGPRVGAWIGKMVTAMQSKRRCSSRDVGDLR